MEEYWRVIDKRGEKYGRNMAETKKQIKTLLNKLIKVAIRSGLYPNLRQLEYPPIVDQLDYIYHNGLDKWKTDVIDPIKAKYPKPS